MIGPCLSGREYDCLQAVGKVLAHTFEGIERLGFTPSDVGAGLALIRAIQMEEEAMIVQTAVRHHISSQAGLFSPTTFAQRGDVVM